MSAVWVMIHRPHPRHADGRASAAEPRAYDEPMRVPAVRLLVVTVALLAGCTSSGKVATVTTTVLPTSPPSTEAVPTVPPPTPAPTSASTGAPTTTTSTTIPVPPSTTIEDLKATIAADFERGSYRVFELLAAPSLDNLDAKLAEVAVPGSEYSAILTKRFQELIAAGDAVVPNDPDILTVKVESVDLVGEAPFTQAKVTYCAENNRRQVNLAAFSPTGEDIQVDGTGELDVTRFTETLQLVGTRWLQFEGKLDATSVEGNKCPA